MHADDEFLLGLKQGDPSAYDTLVARFEGPLYRFFLCEHRDHHVAQEQTSETFTQLVRALPKMEAGPEALRAFVYAVARNVQRRRWRRRPSAHLPIEFADDVADSGLSPGEAAAAREQVEHVLEVLSGLEPPLREVLYLRFIEHLSHEEIAHALEMPVGTVKSHIHRGRIRLKQLFQVTDSKP